MRELIESLERSDDVEYLLDTCFLFDTFRKNHTKKLEDFCTNNKVGMSSFNLLEVDHVHKKMDGTMNHHIRDFLKKKLIKIVMVDVVPGDRAGETAYVQSFNPDILRMIPDASDAVMFVLAIKKHANILTRDKHHVFTTIAENYCQGYDIKVLNDFP